MKSTNHPLARILATILLLCACQPVGLFTLQAQGISAEEFQRLSIELSEPAGFFPSDNLLSNETSFLHVVPKLQQFRAPGEAYIGVGPAQNFTYIAHSRPSLAFIVDIRSDNRLHHLYLKELFLAASNRWEYVSLLLGRPLPRDFKPDSKAGTLELQDFFDRLQPSATYFESNFERLWRAARERSPQILEPRQRPQCLKIALAFFNEGFEIRYRMPRGRTLSVFPTLRNLMNETDLLGRKLHYLESEESYQILRELHEENRIIPVVGDLAGHKTIRAIGNYLRERDRIVSVFYASNVEFYLHRQDALKAYLSNLESLPLSNQSLLIRSFFNFWYGFGRHPDAVDGYYVTSLAQKTEELLRSHKKAPFDDYWDLVTRDYLSNHIALEP